MSHSEAVTTPALQVQRVRHELRRRALRVLSVDSISPNFRRIVLGGPELEGFVSASFDDHLKVFVGSGDAVVGRDYTPRHYDAAKQELSLEFALHGEGPAANWALQAQPGQTVTIGGPRGSFVIPLGYDWHLLAGDETALPAVARRLEELPPGTHAIVRLRVDPADRRDLPSRAIVDLQWSSTADELIASVRAVSLPAGQGYAWCAGEAAASAALRQVLVGEKGHDRHAIRAAAYWKQGAAAHHENLGE